MNKPKFKTSLKYSGVVERYQIPVSLPSGGETELAVFVCEHLVDYICAVTKRISEPLPKPTQSFYPQVYVGCPVCYDKEEAWVQQWEANHFIAIRMAVPARLSPADKVKVKDQIMNELSKPQDQIVSASPLVPTGALTTNEICHWLQLSGWDNLTYKKVLRYLRELNRSKKLYCFFEQLIEEYYWITPSNFGPQRSPKTDH